jgi:hypothetical protein
VPELVKSDHPLNQLWTRCLAAELVAGVCRACANKMGTLEAATEQQLPLLADMNGHPSMSAYMETGYTIISF